MRINFRNHKNALVLSVDRFCDNLLRPAIAVHLRSVNQAHAKLDSQTQRRDFLARALLLSPMRHVPWPSKERACRQEVRRFSFNSIASGKRKKLSPEAFTRVGPLKNGPTECLAGKSSVVC